MGLSTCTKLQLFHCHAQEKTIDNRFPRNEIRIHLRINRKQWIIIYEKLFSLLSFGNYCRGQNQQGGHKPGKYGKLREFEKLSESQGKLRENSGKSQFLK